MALKIEAVPAFTDNIIWVLHDERSGVTAAIDPGEETGVLRLLEQKHWSLDFVLNTHHHADHVGANRALKKATGCQVVGATYDAHRIPAIDIQVQDLDRFWIGKSELQVWHTPGHTTGHVCFWFEQAHAVFTGDTLFLMGCGRLLEGDATSLWHSLSKLATLPPDTQVYCAHEYTENNARFALGLVPDDVLMKTRADQVRALRRKGLSTVPGLMGDELKTNLFLRASEPEMAARLNMRGADALDVFTELRRRKDHFK